MDTNKAWRKIKTQPKIFSSRRKKPANSMRLGKMSKEKEGTFFALASHTGELFSGAIGWD
jgi:hypothetical protein